MKTLRNSGDFRAEYSVAGAVALQMATWPPSRMSVSVIVMPQRDSDKLEFGAMRNIGESVNPRRVKLARGQESSDFLIRAPSNKLDRIPGRALKV